MKPFSKTIEYGDLLAAEHGQLIDLSYGTEIDQQYRAELTMCSAVDYNNPKLVTLYNSIITSYGCSPIQDAMTKERLTMTGYPTPYVVYGDRVFNMMGGFRNSWYDDDYNILKQDTDEIAFMCNYTLNHTPTKEDYSFNSVVDGVTYKQTGYNSMVTGLVSLTMMRKMIADNYSDIADDRRLPLLENLQQQEQHALNCTILYYQFYNALAEDADISIDRKVQPEIKLIYPAQIIL